MKSFHFDIGDSSQGRVGLCMRVQAETPDRAMELANEYFDSQQHTLMVYDTGLAENQEGIEYCHTYVNPAGMSLSDIDDVDDVGDASENAARLARES